MTAVTLTQARKNYLLRSLSEEDLLRLLPKFETGSFKLGEVLYESGGKIDFALFPTTTVVSLLYLMENGATAEIGIVGNDGLLGSALYLGGETTTNRAIIQSAGEGLLMTPKALREEFASGGRFQDLLLRYTQAMMTQISQTAVCNRLHAVEEQLCRWLLLSHDRLNTDSLVMTHDLISNMLGVRREGVTLAAKKLASRNLIKNTRGTIRIVDRIGLEEAVCECYEIVNTEYNRLLGRGISRTFA